MFGSNGSLTIEQILKLKSGDTLYCIKDEHEKTLQDGEAVTFIKWLGFTDMEIETKEGIRRSKSRHDLRMIGGNSSLNKLEYWTEEKLKSLRFLDVLIKLSSLKEENIEIREDNIIIFSDFIYDYTTSNALVWGKQKLTDEDNYYFEVNITDYVLLKDILKPGEWIKDEMRKSNNSKKGDLFVSVNPKSYHGMYRGKGENERVGDIIEFIEKHKDPEYCGLFSGTNLRTGEFYEMFSLYGNKHLKYPVNYDMEKITKILKNGTVPCFTIK